MSQVASRLPVDDDQELRDLERELAELDDDERLEAQRLVDNNATAADQHSHTSDETIEQGDMQRSSSRNVPFSAGGVLPGGLFTGKNGVVDRQKTFLVVLCFVLGMYTFYDFLCHLHQNSFDSAMLTVEQQMRASAGDAQPIGGVLRAPGSIDGKLPESLMFTYLDSQKSSFLNSAGVLAFPLQADHLVQKTINGMHVATILPGQTRGNHMHTKHPEVIVLVHGHYLLRVAMIGNDGVWSSEDHLFEIGLPGNPFSSAATTISSTPIGIQIPPNVCHALRNLSPTTTGFFASYYVLGMDQQREEPDRATCRAQPKAFLGGDV